MTNYTAFLPEVAPHCDGAPEPMIVGAIRNAAIEFCERSWVWIDQTSPQALIKNTQDYELFSTVAGTKIAQVLYGTYNGKEIAPAARDDVISRDPDWRNTVGSAPQEFIAKDGGATVSIIPIPNQNVAVGTGKIVNDGMHFTVALKPGRTQTSVPDWIYEDHLEVIAHGALFRLYAMPKKAWTNANLAAVHKTMFEDGIAAARVSASRSFTRAPLRNSKTGVAKW